jgi:hypothetical protein
MPLLLCVPPLGHALYHSIQVDRCWQKDSTATLSITRTPTLKFTGFSIFLEYHLLDLRDLLSRTDLSGGQIKISTGLVYNNAGDMLQLSVY